MFVIAFLYKVDQLIVSHLYSYRVDIWVNLFLWKKIYKYSLQKAKFNTQILTLNLLNFKNGIIHLQFLELSIIIYQDENFRAWSVFTDVQAGLTILVFTGGKG